MLWFGPSSVFSVPRWQNFDFMDIITNLFNKLHPQRQHKPETVERILGALAATPDNQALYCAVQDHLHDQVTANLLVALNFNTPDTDRLRALDRAAALYDTSVLLEADRVAAKEAAKQREADAKQRTEN